MKSLYLYKYIYIYIRTCTKAVCPLIIFTKPLKKQNKSGIQVSHLFFNQKKHMGEILKNNGEWVNCGWKPTNLFWNREKFPVGIACRPACCPSDPFMDWSSSSGIESSDSILLSVKFNDVATCRAIIRFLIKKKSTHTQMNEYMGGHFMDMFLPPKKEKLWRFYLFFLGKDMRYFLHRSTFFLTVILPTLPPKKTLETSFLQR